MLLTPRRSAAVPPHSHARQIKLICESNIIVCVSFSFLLPARCTHAYYFFFSLIAIQRLRLFLTDLQFTWVMGYTCRSCASVCVLLHNLLTHTHVTSMREKDAQINKTTMEKIRNCEGVWVPLSKSHGTTVTIVVAVPRIDRANRNWMRSVCRNKNNCQKLEAHAVAVAFLWCKTLAS